jgi:hypothetical protein
MTGNQRGHLTLAVDLFRHPHRRYTEPRSMIFSP